MPHNSSLHLADLIACVDRELKLRRKVYPRWVRDKKLTQEQADTELARMQAVRDALVRGEAARRLAERLSQKLGTLDAFHRRDIRLDLARMCDEVTMNLRLEKEPQGRLT